MTNQPVPTITDEQIAEIECCAKVATQGQWQVADGYYPSIKEIKGPSFNVSIVVAATDLDFKDYMARTADAEHIAGCNPTAILALISRLRAAERDAARYQWLKQKAEREDFDYLASHYPSQWEDHIDASMKGEQQ